MDASLSSGCASVLTSLTPRCAPAPAFGTGAPNFTHQRYHSGNTITTDRWATSDVNVFKQAARKYQNACPTLLCFFELLIIYLTVLVSAAISPGQSARASDVQWSLLEKWDRE